MCRYHFDTEDSSIFISIELQRTCAYPLWIPWEVMYVVCFWGRSLEDSGVPHQRHDQSQGLCILRQVWQRGTRVLIWMCQLLLSAWQTFHMLTLPGKPWLERHKKGSRQTVVSTSESSNSSSRLWGQLFELQTKQGRDSACKMPVIFLVVCSIASFIP